MAVNSSKDVWGTCLQYWRFIVAVISPCALIPIYFVSAEEDSNKFRCAYVILLMAVYWMTEAIPLAVTALIPLVLFPLFNIQATDAVCQNYMSEAVMVFIAATCLALSIEYSGLHKRIALRFMILAGTSHWRLLFGFMATSFFLSCWIVSTAAVAMMIPVVSGFLDDLPQDGLEGASKKKLKKLFMLAIGYASNIGGTAVLIGSNANLIAKGLLSAEDIGQGGKYTDINFATWIAYAMPIALVNLLISCCYLGFAFIGLPRWTSWSRKEAKTHESSSEISPAVAALRLKLSELGPVTFHEICVVFLFVLVMTLWFTKDPQIFPGWASLLDSTHVSVGDSTVSAAVVLIMFIVPKALTVRGGPAPGALLSWPFIQRNLPWNVMLLIGGGFALSDGAQKSGLANWIGEQLSALENLSNPLILLVSLLLLSSLTEVLSNSACVNLILPILIALSRRMDLHPLYLCLPGVIASQFAFMLPVSNANTALVFAAADLRILEMVKAGAFLNVICLAVLFGMNITWGELIFKYGDYNYADAGNKTTGLSSYQVWFHC